MSAPTSLNNRSSSDDAANDGVTDHAATVEHAQRLVPLDASFNFRDLGGYTLADGRTTSFGRIFRADGLYRLTDDDIDVIDGLGIRTVIDLRTSNELTARGTFPVEKYPVAFHHLSIIDATWHETGVPDFDATEQGGIDFLVWAYRDMLRQGGDRFAEALATLAVPGSGPAVFHCAAGKDRTGLLAAMILGGLGVDHEVIALDYGLTVAGMDRMRAWLGLNMPEALADMNARPQHMFGAHPEAMRQILRDLVSEHGSVAGYLASIGVGNALLAAVGDQLTT